MMTGIRRDTALAILATGVAGCGTSSSPSSSAGSSSPAAYRAQVNKICVANNAKITALPKRTGSSVSGLDKLLTIEKVAVAQVTAVRPPSSMRSAVQSWLGTVEQSASTATNLVSAVKAQNKTQVQTLGALAQRLNAQANTDAKSLGLPSCAENPQPSG